MSFFAPRTCSKTSRNQYDNGAILSRAIGLAAARGSEGGDGEHVSAAVGGVAGDVAFIGHVAELFFHG